MVSDQHPLLPSDGKVEESTNGSSFPVRRIAARVGMVALACGAVAATISVANKPEAKSSTALAQTAPMKTMAEMDLEKGLASSAPSGNAENPWPGSHEVLLYKRTMPTATPAADCQFMTEVLGFQCSYLGLTDASESGKSTDATCGARAQGTASEFSYHLIRDMFHPQGVAEKAIEKIDSIHGEMKQDEWDPFMVYSVSNFVPDLSDFVEQWKKLGVNFRSHSYTNTADSTTMYVGMVAMPSTGAIFEMHALTVDEKYKHLFTSLPDAACGIAVDTGFEASTLHKWWTENKGDMNHGIDGLPDSIVVKITHPTTAAKHASNWMFQNAGLDFEVDEKSSSVCSTASTVLKTFSGPGYAKVAFVELKTEHADERVTDYVKLIEGTHANWVGTQTGWDRFMDNHIGLVYKNQFLDALAPQLIRNSVRFHAHQPSAGLSEEDPVCNLYDTIVDQCGSIWTEGVSGLGIEMHGLFDYNFFEGDFYPTSLDFCHVSSSGDDEAS
jgi:hypothetical protein